ncbi:uncharacterized protein L201_005985 [Kwoniella dendrophila CBS 6074]|uniref:Uncharacterized protein n=1 Tax=Kwoniella dendrophila CBS 6074 TaxID=1295534 RepID=A0AAX4K083_9TREE
MVSLTLATTFALAATLGTQSTFARPTATTNVVLKTSSGGSSAPVVWPFTGTAHAERKRNTEDSNASRLARGLPLKAPVKRHELDRRLTPAPSAGVGSDESFEFVTCSGGGSTSGTYTSVSGNTNQDLVNACAASVPQTIMRSTLHDSPRPD